MDAAAVAVVGGAGFFAVRVLSRVARLDLTPRRCAPDELCALVPPPLVAVGAAVVLCALLAGVFIVVAVVVALVAGFVALFDEDDEG